MNDEHLSASLNVFRNALWGEAQELERIHRLGYPMMSRVLFGLGDLVDDIQCGRYKESDELKRAVQDCIARNMRPQPCD